MTDTIKRQDAMKAVQDNLAFSVKATIIAAINALPAADEWREIDVAQLNAIQQAASDMLGYMSDNSCGDPECCGGPYYERADFERGDELLRSLGLRYAE